MGRQSYAIDEHVVYRLFPDRCVRSSQLCSNELRRGEMVQEGCVVVQASVPEEAAWQKQEAVQEFESRVCAGCLEQYKWLQEYCSVG